MSSFRNTKWFGSGVLESRSVLAIKCAKIDYNVMKKIFAHLMDITGIWHTQSSEYYIQSLDCILLMAQSIQGPFGSTFLAIGSGFVGADTKRQSLQAFTYF